MKLMSNERIKKSMLNVRATLGVEGIKMNRRSVVYGTKYLRGQMTSEQAINNITDYILSKYRK
ncbi:hypothetical protein BHU72_01555 [Desulfuribacillus stibiiarsenatis]|uniref:Antitoxin VbhA domain-containing protein n=1 Tax=Desulfuribacillus stibiiarsenatis TaxID=1390249 RepID=A0A1E5LA08_9FIRM|nr:hypothetical protein [Desulfuribacillus stibiiarsenatis]OEH86970.1 hypothetical protein BHU72_01555 [Desulfuribacillus stibiiarsenatis]